MGPFDKDLPPAHILIVEDDPIQRDVLQSALRHYGYEVETSANGLDAIRRIEGGCHDLVLLDYQLPEIDGLGVARLIGEFDAQVGKPPLIALTSTPDLLENRETLAAGEFDDIVAKPIAIPLLLKTIRRHLDADIGRADRQAARVARLERQWAEYGVGAERPGGRDVLLGPVHILVVEDDVLQQSVLRSVLENRGYTVEIAADGIEAVRLIRTMIFDLVLVDYLLPEIDGLAVGRLVLDLMHEDIRPRMLALTAARDDLTERQIETGNAFDEILSKSSDLAALLASVDRHLRSSPNSATRRAAQFVTPQPEALSVSRRYADD